MARRAALAARPRHQLSLPAVRSLVLRRAAGEVRALRRPVRASQRPRPRFNGTRWKESGRSLVKTDDHYAGAARFALRSLRTILVRRTVKNLSVAIAYTR